MRILITGATGTIGKPLLIATLQAGHKPVALVRSATHLNIPESLHKNLTIIEADLLNPHTLTAIPPDIEAAYFLVHSMGHTPKNFSQLEERCAQNFIQAIESTQARQIIYLSGLTSEKSTSEHMRSRHRVAQILRSGKTPVTTLRAGIIIGNGSASFEIIRDLVEKLPMMIAPRWVTSRCQPIAIHDALYYLQNTLNKQECLSKTFDIGGPDILTYRDMLLQFAKTRKLKRLIIPIPLLTPHLSSLWLCLITTAKFSIAKALVHSLKMDAVCQEHTIHTILPHTCDTYQQALQRTFTTDIAPHFGVYKDRRKLPYSIPHKTVLSRLWSIGGNTGWYALNWAWKLRALIDRLIGGAGNRRGRTHPTEIHKGDTLDFWRVIEANQNSGHLLLFAEMRLPGEAWLEWRIANNTLEQTATFRPKGLLGRLYWWTLFPLHKLIFSRLTRYLIH